MDKLEINGIRCYGYTGFFSEEQTLGQWFEVDLTFWLDLSTAGQSDRLQDTLDYRRVVGTVKTIVQQSKFALIEKLIETIALNILETEPINKVQVRLIKVAPPIPDFSGSIKLEITRSR
jgi:dihydroneopterin aldolase